MTVSGPSRAVGGGTVITVGSTDWVLGLERDPDVA